MAPFTDVDKLCVNTIRTLAADVVQGAASGHPGAPMGLAPVAHVLFSRIMRFNPANPDYINRDRFVLSNGHACALQYIMLHLLGYQGMTMDQLKNFRQVGSITPGHPENTHAAGIEVTTGPLGQGVANSVGLAIAAKQAAATYGEIIDSNIFCICGDGCMQEGVSKEASSLAGHLKLDNLVVIYDDNSISIDGPTSHSFSESVPGRYAAYGWHVITVDDGNHDLAGLQKAIEEAVAYKGKPVFISVKTTIGFSSSKEGTGGVHGSPLGEEDLANVKSKLGFDPNQKYVIPDQVKQYYQDVASRGEKLESAWQSRYNSFKSSHAEKAKTFERILRRELPSGWEKCLPSYQPSDKAAATRATSGNAIAALYDTLPELIGGSADLTPSNNTRQNKELVDFQASSPEGRYLRFGIREHGMAAISNGIARFGIHLPFCATFLVFIEYAAPAWRLSALSQAQVLYIMTHDSIGLGEDGPTHQPIEHLTFLRSMPNSLTMRPADGNETNGCYVLAMEHRNGPSVFCLSRHGVPQLEGSSIENVRKGGYTIFSSGPSPKVIIASTGTEVTICIDAAKELASKGTHAQVVSVPCWEVMFSQGTDYLKKLFPSGVPVLAVEPYVMLGWERIAHDTLGMRGFGHSGKQKDVYKHFGFTVENIAKRANALIQAYSGRQAPDLLDRPGISVEGCTKEFF